LAIFVNRLAASKIKIKYILLTYHFSGQKTALTDMILVISFDIVSFTILFLAENVSLPSTIIRGNKIFQLVVPLSLFFEKGQ